MNYSTTLNKKIEGSLYYCRSDFELSEERGEVKGITFTLSVVAVVLFSLFSSEVWARYTCPDGTVSAGGRRVNCKKKDWRSCVTGSVIWEPECAQSCRNKVFAQCLKIKRRQERECVNYIPAASADCPKLAEERRKKCAELSKDAQGRCSERASFEPCDNIFDREEARCKERLAHLRERCIDQRNRRLKACKRFELQRKRRNDQICQPLFKKCLRRCVPMTWPCKKKCFAQRHKCFQKGREQYLKCRQAADRLFNDCEINNDRFNVRCIRKAEDKKYLCMQKIRKKRVLCLIKVGERYNRCVWKTLDFQLKCWFKEMDKKYLCSGKAFSDCRARLAHRLRLCLRRCPRCTVKE